MAAPAFGWDSLRSSSGGLFQPMQQQQQQQQQQGVPPTREEMKPFFGVKSWAFILRVTRALKLGKVVTHTALVFFHRFFKQQDFQNHDRLLMAATCIYLATKIEEKEKVCRLSAIVCQYLKFVGLLDADVDHMQYGKDSRAKELVPDWKNRFIVYERALLYTIGFDLNVEHPFKSLNDQMKTVREYVIPTDKNFEPKLFFTQACKFLNDSMSLSLIVDAEPQTLASMALYLTALLYEISPKSRTWAEVLCVNNEETFYADCATILSLYDVKNYKRLHLENVPGLLTTISSTPLSSTGLLSSFPF